MRQVRNRKLLLLVCMLGMLGCHMGKRLSSALGSVIDMAAVMPVATARVFSAVSREIYVMDSLPDRSTVTMHLHLRFCEPDTLHFQYDNVRFHCVGDSINYETVLSGKWEARRYADTMRCIVDCSYTTPVHPEPRRFQVSYMVLRNDIQRLN